jgi:uroporphyrinogen decarboxylase
VKHRERVMMALNHEAPDRCPMQISFTPEFAERLRADLALNDRGLTLSADRMGHNPHGGGNTYELERALGEDMLLTSVGWANSYYQAGDAYTDEWGIEWRAVPYDTPFGTGYYTEMVHHPLADATTISRYHAPDPSRPELYRDAAWTIEQFKDEYWIVGVTVTTIWETAWALRGYAQMLTDLATKPELVEAILDIPYQYHLTAARKLVQLGVDMIWVGDDVGAQRTMLISPAMWRRFLKPRLAGFIAAIKGINPRLKVAYHSDGCIWPIIPDLIEIGLDVLNPIQPASMDPAEMKRKYGDRLCFWGTIDEQHTLPFGTPETVATEVSERLRTVGAGGGLIIGPTHHVQLDTPMENFWAMVESITGEGVEKHMPHRLVTLSLRRGLRQ